MTFVLLTLCNFNQTIGVQTSQIIGKDLLYAYLYPKLWLNAGTICYITYYVLFLFYLRLLNIIYLFLKQTESMNLQRDSYFKILAMLVIIQTTTYFYKSTVLSNLNFI